MACSLAVAGRGERGLGDGRLTVRWGVCRVCSYEKLSQEQKLKRDAKDERKKAKENQGRMGIRVSQMIRVCMWM